MTYWLWRYNDKSKTIPKEHLALLCLLALRSHVMVVHVTEFRWACGAMFAPTTLFKTYSQIRKIGCFRFSGFFWSFYPGTFVKDPMFAVTNAVPFASNCVGGLAQCVSTQQPYSAASTTPWAHRKRRRRGAVVFCLQPSLKHCRTLLFTYMISLQGKDT